MPIRNTHTPCSLVIGGVSRTGRRVISSPAVSVQIGERHFRHAVAEYVEHYHRERNHQGLDNRLISGPPVMQMTRRVRRHARLGGLLNFYHRAA